MESIQVITIVTIVVSLISGGLAGAIANIAFSKSKDKRDIAFRIIDYYFTIYTDIGITKGILASPGSLSDVKHLTTVRKVGDWFHLVASLLNKKKNAPQEDLLRTFGVIDELKRFRENILVAKNRERELHDAWGWWPETEKFKDR